MILDSFGNLIAQSPGSVERTAMAPVDMNGFPIRNAGSIGLATGLTVTAVPGGVLKVERHSTVVLDVDGGATIEGIEADRAAVGFLLLVNGNAAPVTLRHTDGFQLYASSDRTLQRGEASFLVQIEAGIWREISGDPGVTVRGPVSVIGDVSGLQAALDAKAALAHTHLAAEISDATAAGRAVLTAADAAAQRAALGLILGSNVQVYDTDLAAIAALVSAANKMPYATGVGTWALADLTAFARTLLAAADAATMRAMLGAGTSSVSDLDGLSDVAIAALAVGQALAYTASGWANKTLRSETLGPWYFTNVAADQNGAWALVTSDGPPAVVARVSIPTVMRRAGRVVGGRIVSDPGRAAGTATLKALLNGVTTSFAADAVVLDATYPASNSAQVAFADGLAFAAGDTLGTHVDVSALWSTGPDMQAWLTVAYDPF